MQLESTACSCTSRCGVARRQSSVTTAAAPADDLPHRRVRRGFAARQLEDVAGAQLVQVRLHLRNAFEHERVEPVAGGGIGARETFVTDQRQIHPVGRLRRIHQGVVGFHTPVPAAPVQDIPAAAPDWLVVECPHARIHDR